MNSYVRLPRGSVPRRAASGAAFVVAALIAALPQHPLRAQGMGAQPYPADSSGPLALHFKGVTITPGGFFAGEALWRQKNITADMGSSYQAIPYSGTSAAALSEWRGSGRQSRISLLAVGNAGDVKLSGYYETDFLGAGVTSNSNESDSYALRIRQFWGQINTKDGWNFAFGQMWSLLTSDRRGMAPRSEWVPLTIEAQYVPGFNWARQFELRVWKNLGKTVAFGLAVDGSQTTYAARNPPSNFLLGAPGLGGSLLNSTANYSTDLAPDLIAKVAIDPDIGQHYEIKAIGRVFRDRVIDVTDTLGGSHNSVVYGGGLGAAAIWSFYASEGGHHRDVADFGISGLWGSGIGRYASSGLPDATVRANGEIVPILGASGLVGLELHPHRLLDIYFYGGADYADRTYFYASPIKTTGYGSPLNNNSGCATETAPTPPYTIGAVTCNGDTRALWQAGGGFWYRFLQGAYGTFAWGVQYTYTSRNTWSGLPGAMNPTGPGLQPQAFDPMAFTSFRYYMP